MSYPNGKARNVVLLRPGERDIYYMHYDNAVLRGAREMLYRRYRFVAIGKKDGRILAVIKRTPKVVLIERV